MLEIMEVINFQKWKKKRVVFDPYCTTFIGPTDSGKSALAVRALFWLCLNRPQGDEFITNGEEQCEVRLKVDGHRVVRKKGKGNNLYVINKQRRKAFGTGTPEDIQKLLNVDELNFQRQLDSPLWFFETAGSVARELNRIVRLDIIDSTTTRIASRVRRNKERFDLCNEQLEEAVKKQKELDWSLEANKEIEKIDKLKEELEDLNKKERNLENILEEIKEQQEIREIKIPTKEIKEIEELIEEMKVADREEEKLNNLLEEIKEQQKELCQIKKESIQVEKQMKEITKGRCPICQGPM